MGEGADRAADRGHGDFLARRQQTARGCERTRRNGRRASGRNWSARRGCRGCGRWSACTCARTRARFSAASTASRSVSSRSAAWVSCTDRQVSSTSRTGHAQMHEAAVRADRLGEPGQEGDDVVAGFPLDRVDALDVGGIDARRASAPPFSRMVRAADLPGWRRRGHRLGGQRLDLEPDAEAVLRRPDGGHFRAGVTGNHAALIGLARRDLRTRRLQGTTVPASAVEEP